MGCEDVKWSCGEGVMWREREERAEEGEGEGVRGGLWWIFAIQMGCILFQVFEV